MLEEHEQRVGAELLVVICKHAVMKHTPRTPTAGPNLRPQGYGPGTRPTELGGLEVKSQGPCPFIFSIRSAERSSTCMI